MSSPDQSRQAELRAQLSSALASLHRPSTLAEINVLVSHCEINERHGTGILLKHIFSSGAAIATIRSHDLYDGRQHFGDRALRISHTTQDRSQVAAHVLKAFNDVRPARVLSVPYFRDDVLSTIALHDLFHAPVGTFLMDDQNIYAPAIPDEEIRELLNKSAIRFGISRELCEAYENKYELPFHLLPPVVPGRLIQRDEPTLGEVPDSTPGILLGNLWSQLWLDRLRAVTRETGVRLDWYGNPQRDWLNLPGLRAATRRYHAARLRAGGQADCIAEKVPIRSCADRHHRCARGSPRAHSPEPSVPPDLHHGDGECSCHSRRPSR